LAVSFAEREINFMANQEEALIGYLKNFLLLRTASQNKLDFNL
jgi:hypothetical protein